MSSLKRIIEEEGIQISQTGIFSIARESEGSLRDAQSLLDQVISYGGKEIRDEDIVEVLGLIDQKILYDTIEAIASRDAERCMEIIEELYHYGVDLQHFCRELLQYLRNLTLMKVSQHPERLIELPKEELEVLKSQAERFQFDHLNHLFSLLLKGEEEVAQSAFPRTMMEMTLIRMATLKPILPIDEILKKLEILEKKPSSLESVSAIESPSLIESLSSDRFQKRNGLEEASDKVLKGIRKKEVFEKEELPMGLTEEIEPLSSEKAMESELSPKGGEIEGGSQKVREETWRGLVDFTRAQNPILGSFLALGNLVHISEEKIELGFEKDSFHYDRILEEENRRQLEAICHEYLQRKAKVVISPLEQGVKSRGRGLLETEGVAQSGFGRRLEKGTEENSIIQEALRLFDGKIVGK
jgi:DNA polymerase-3 subunit gamma/tau